MEAAASGSEAGIWRRLRKNCRREGGEVLGDNVDEDGGKVAVEGWNEGSDALLSLWSKVKVEWSVGPKLSNCLDEDALEIRGKWRGQHVRKSRRNRRKKLGPAVERGELLL